MASRLSGVEDRGCAAAPAIFDSRAYRTALGAFATGVTVVSAQVNDGAGPASIGLTVNSFTSVSLDPPLILWSMKNTNPNLPRMRQASHFAVNVLALDQAPLSLHFARPLPDRFDEVPHDVGLGGAPLLPGSAATFECAQHSHLDGGDHTVFFGRVERFTRTDKHPLIFYGGAWCALTGVSA